MTRVDWADVRDPVTCTTRRERNRAKRHAYPVGSLVSVLTGGRMYVIEHYRDADDYPFYKLAEAPHECRSWRILDGYTEPFLTLVRLPTKGVGDA